MFSNVTCNLTRWYHRVIYTKCCYFKWLCWFIYRVSWASRVCRLLPLLEAFTGRGPDVSTAAENEDSELGWDDFCCCVSTSNGGIATSGKNENNQNLAILRMCLFWGMVKWPFGKVVGDLQLGDTKVTDWITWNDSVADRWVLNTSNW